MLVADETVEFGPHGAGRFLAHVLVVTNMDRDNETSDFLAVPSQSLILHAYNPTEQSTTSVTPESTTIVQPEPSRLTPHAIKQLIKWTVYTVLIINFGFYVWDDWRMAQHTLRAGGTIVEWAGAFVTTIDELAWFALLALFELETYALSDEVAYQPGVEKLMHGVRIICYVFLAHTIYAYSIAVMDLYPTEPVPGVNSLCQLADQDLSYTNNLEYTVIDSTNCSQLSGASEFFYSGSGSVVADAEGLGLDRALAWVDLVEASVWLLIVFTIEFMVRMQSRGVTGGSLMTAANLSKIVLYGVLLIITAYWGFLTHWLYVWDELVWIAGFAAIEMNVAEWRGEILEGEQSA